MNKKLIRLTETDLSKIVLETLKKIVPINEYFEKDYGIPLYNTLKKHYEGVGVVNNTWLIHITKHPIEIMTNGFSNGVSKDYMLNNPLSMNMSGFADHEDKGYSWAYEASAIDYYYDLNCSDALDDENSSVILFQANGVRYVNGYDNEPQVVFYNKTARNKILIYKWKGLPNKKDKYEKYGLREYYAVGNVNEKPLHIGSFQNVIKWCITNFDQYKKYLLSNKKPIEISDEEIDNIDADYEKYLDRKGYGKDMKWYDSNDESKYENELNRKKNDAYLEYLKPYENNINKILATIENPTPETVDKIRDLLAPYDKFYDKFTREHPYKNGRRPDGNFWRKTK